MRSEFLQDTLIKRKIILKDMIIKQNNLEFSKGIKKVQYTYCETKMHEDAICFSEKCNDEIVSILSGFLWDVAYSKRICFLRYKSTIYNFIKDLLFFVPDEWLENYMIFKCKIKEEKVLEDFCKKNKEYKSRLKHLCEYCRCHDYKIPSLYEIPLKEYDEIIEQTNRDDARRNALENMKQRGVINFLELFACFGSSKGYETYNSMLSSADGHCVRYYLDISLVKDEKIINRMLDFISEMISSRGEEFSFYSRYISSFSTWCEYEFKDRQLDYKMMITDINEGELTCGYVAKKIAKTFMIYCQYKDAQQGTFYENDIWDVNIIKLSKERINLTSKINYISFKDIKGDDNKRYIKEFARFLLQNTNLGIMTIRSKIRSLIINTKILDKSLFELEAQDLERLAMLSNSVSTFNANLYTLKSFFDFYARKGVGGVDIRYSIQEFVGKYKRKYIVSAVPDYVIVQIFNILNRVKKDDDQLFFLILYCTGMRGSEVCLLERNCLHKEKGCYYIHYYQQKMRKDVQNEIPKSMYDLLKDYIKSLPKGKQYIFSKNKLQDVPGVRSTYVNRLKKEFIQLGVKNEDGTPYIFKPHTYRHRMAVDMDNNKIPQPFIQEQLHHNSPEMTLAYLEYIGKKKIADMKNPVDYQGNRLLDEKKVENVTQDDYLAYKRKDINSLIVMGGVCGRPKKLGVCQKGNMCLYCEHFRTSVDFLPVLKRMLKEIDGLINRIGIDSDDMLTVKMKRDKRALLHIISKLEKGV